MTSLSSFTRSHPDQLLAQLRGVAVTVVRVRRRVLDPLRGLEFAALELVALALGALELVRLELAWPPPPPRSA